MLASTLDQRLKDDNNQLIFEIGLEGDIPDLWNLNTQANLYKVDDGTSMELSQELYEKALKNVIYCCESLNADATVLHERTTSVLATSSSVANGPAVESISPTGHKFGHLLIRPRLLGKVEELSEVRICVTGNVDAGKSTLLGVLTKNTLDDGRGKARVNLFRFKHELESGRTSSVGNEVMGFDSKGQIVTAPPGKKLGPDEICLASSKVITFLDLAGHEKYLKTTVFGMTGCSPDFVMLMIGANAGIIGMTKEHLGLALALQVPVYIVITKIDMCPANVLEATVSQLTKILKSSGCRKIPMFINNMEDVLISSTSFVSERVCPIFQVSNVSGEGLDLLRMFINLLTTSSQSKYNVKGPAEYQITDTFSVPGKN